MSGEPDEPPAAGPGPPPDPARGRWVWPLLALILLYGFSVRARLAALDHPLLTSAPEAGVLKSDPALLAYFTERIVEADGWVPEDFRADPRVQHPALTDIPGEFTVGQEFLVAWAYRLLGSSAPLHVFAQRVMAFCAGLIVPALYLLVWARTRRVGWALLAAALACALPASYRTDGFVLVREDLSLPLFALHLALLARAARRRSAATFLLAGVLAAAALATWHAMAFVLAFELGLLHLWFLRPGPSPFEVPGAWAVLVAPVLAAVLVPALATSGALLGLPMQLAGALLVVALVRRRRELGRAASVGVVLGAWIALAALSWSTSPARSSYAHVQDVMWAKLAHLGVRPADPTVLPFDARLLWQGPFESISPAELASWLGWGGLCLLFVLVVVAWRARRRLGGFELWLLALGLAALPLSLLVGRTVALCGILLPACAAVLFEERRRRALLALLMGIAALQGFSFLGSMGERELPWYRPAIRQHELSELVAWVESNVEPGAAIAADFMNGPALLLHTGHPIVLQPKYETEASRRRAQAFLETFFRGTPEELSRLLRERWDCELLLVDRFTLGVLSPWVAGVPPTPLPGTAAELLLSTDDEVLSGVPGYELVYRSPDRLRGLDGQPSDFYRLFRLR